MKIVCVFIILFKLVCSIRLGNLCIQHTKNIQPVLICNNNKISAIQNKNDLNNRWKIASLSSYKLKLYKFVLYHYYLYNKIILKYSFNKLRKKLFDDFKSFFNKNNVFLKKCSKNNEETKESSQSSNYPLVGNTWIVEFDYKPNLNMLNNQTEKMVFFDRGTVVTSSGLKGTWWTDFGELVWKFPLENRRDSYVYFNAQFYVNKFNNKAYMRRGVVFKDRTDSKWFPKNLFRPVVCTFKAYCS